MPSNAGSPRGRWESTSGVAAWRGLDFDDVNAEVARSAYGRLVVGGEFGARAADLKAFQDYTFRYLAGEAGRVGLVMHVKTGMSRDATGIVGFGNPNLLGSSIADPRLSKTRWLLVHGGFPFDKETGPMLLRPECLRGRVGAGPGAFADRAR